MIIYGISSTITREKGVFTAIEMVGESPFKYMELRCESGHFDYESIPVLKDVNNLLTENRLKVSSLHPPGWVNISSGEEWERMKSVREIEKIVLVAHRIGAGKVILHPGGENGILEKTEESLKEILEFSGEWNVDIVLENAFPGRYGSEPDELRKIFNSSDIQMCLDTSHAAAMKDRVSEYIELFEDRIIHFHLSDSLIQGRDDHLFPGEGKINWGKFYKFLNRFSGTIIFELPPQDDVEEVLSCLYEVKRHWERDKIYP